MKKINRRFVTGFLLTSILIVVLLAPFASTHPDGLESVAEKTGLSKFDRGTLIKAIFPDYEATFVRNPWLSTVISGIVGIFATFALASGLYLILTRRKDGTRILR